MTNPADKIHVAYATSRKGGLHYRARAYVVSNMAGRDIVHGMTICIEDCPEAATAGAIRYIKESYARDGLRAPSDVICHGRKSAAIVDNYLSHK